MPKSRGQGLARLALLFGVISLRAASGHRPGLSLRDGCRSAPPCGSSSTWASYGGIAATVLALIALAWGRGTVHGRIGRHRARMRAREPVLSPFRFQQAAGAVPPIHDITTDIVTPPQYVETAALRRELRAPNSLELPVDDHQPAGCGLPGDPAAVPRRCSPADAYAEGARRWCAPAAGRWWRPTQAGRRIEATDTTFWFRFKDDVAVRVSAVPDGTSRVDMRSVSRLGRSDLGTNARRIREFLADLAR